MRILNLALCGDRHEIPHATEGYIFETINNITSPKSLEETAFSRLWSIAYNEGYVIPSDDDEYQLYISNDVHINLYVTGLTVALIAVLNVCRAEGLSVTLWHYDKITNNYFSQEVR